MGLSPQKCQGWKFDPKKKIPYWAHASKSHFKVYMIYMDDVNDGGSSSMERSGGVNSHKPLPHVAG